MKIPIGQRNREQIDEHKRRWDSIAEGYRNLFGHREARNETFDEAVERLELDDEKLQSRRRELVIEHRILLGAALAVFLLGFVPGTLFPFAIGLMAAGGLAVNAAARAMRVRQIDTRTLHSPADWIRDPAYWLI